jgi:hypothetical protein
MALLAITEARTSETQWPPRDELNMPLSGDKALLLKACQRPPGCNMLRLAQPVRPDPINFRSNV